MDSLCESSVIDAKTIADYESAKRNYSKAFADKNRLAGKWNDLAREIEGDAFVPYSDYIGFEALELPELPQPEPEPEPEPVSTPVPEEPQQEEQKPEEPQPEEQKPAEPNSDEQKPEEPMPNEQKPEEPQPEEPKPIEPNPEDAKPEEPKDSQSEPEVTKPESSDDNNVEISYGPEEKQKSPEPERQDKAVPETDSPSTGTSVARCGCRLIVVICDYVIGLFTKILVVCFKRQ